MNRETVAFCTKITLTVQPGPGVSDTVQGLISCQVHFYGILSVGHLEKHVQSSNAFQLNEAAEIRPMIVLK